MNDDRDLLLQALARQLGYRAAAPPGTVTPSASPEPTPEVGEAERSPRPEHAPPPPPGAPPASLLEVLVDETIRLSGGDARRALASLPPGALAAVQLDGHEAAPAVGAGLSATVRRPSRDERGATASLEPGHLGLEDTQPSGETRSPVRAAPSTPDRYAFDTGPNGGMEELGRGGVGRVVVARDRFVGRTVAMKELLPGHVSDPAADTDTTSLLEERFAREARLTGLIDHPAVVPVYELGRRANGTLYYTMQRVRGRTLSSALEAATSLDERLELVRAFLTVCRGVAAAHEQGIIHRDLKPQNVMLGAFGATYVMDWGLARIVATGAAPQGVMDAAPTLTAAHSLGAVGTPAYMPPEQARGEHERVDARSDVWGLGAILFELLTRRPPFDGPSAWHVLAAVSRDPPPQVLSLEPEAPPELAAICQKALQREPEGRYPSARAMADDVEAWLAGRRVTAYRYDLSEITRRIGRRNRRAFAALGAGLLGLLVAFSSSVSRARAERDDARAFARFALDEVIVELAEAQGSAELVRRLLDSSLDVWSQGVALEEAPREDLLRLATVLVRLGELAVRRGAVAEALEVTARARPVLRELTRRFPHSLEVQSVALELDTVAAELPMIEGEVEPVVAGLRALKERADALRARGASELRALDAAARLYERLGAAEHNAGQAVGGLRSEHVALELLEQRAALTPRDPRALARLGELLAHNAASRAAEGQSADALEQGARALSTVERALALEPSGIARLAQGSVTYTLGLVHLHASLSEPASSPQRAALHARGMALVRQALTGLDAVLRLEPTHLEARWRSVEAALVLGELESAERLAAPLAGTKGNEPLLALAAFGSGRTAEAARWASLPSGFYATDRHFLRAALAELSGDRQAALAALDALAGTRRVELVLLAPWVVRASLASDTTARGERVRRWCELLLAAPSQAPFFEAAARQLAQSARAEAPP